MRFITLAVSALLTISSAAPLVPSTEKRNAASIVAALANVQTQIQALNTSVTAFQTGQLDGIIRVLKIQQQTNRVGDAVEATIDAANACGPLSSDDSNKVAVGVIGLKSSLDTLLPNLESKKDAFDHVILGVGSVSPQIAQSLRKQKAQSNELSDAIASKLASPYKDAAPLINGQINTAFDKAIATFSTPGGLFALPAFPTFDSFSSALLDASEDVGLVSETGAVVPDTGLVPDLGLL